MVREAGVKVLGLCADAGVPVDGTKGATVHLHAIWNALARAGCEVEAVARWRGGAVPASAAGVRIHRVPSQGAGLLLRILETAAVLDADIVVERLALGSALGVSLARARGVPLVVEVNAPLDEEADRWRRATTSEEREAMARTLCGADLVVTVSEPLAPWARERG